MLKKAIFVVSRATLIFVSRNTDSRSDHDKALGLRNAICHSGRLGLTFMVILEAAAPV